MIRLFLFFLFLLSVGFSKPLELEINAKNAILINAENGAVLFEKKADTQIFPASITKVFSLWYILEKHINDLNSSTLASSHALKVVTPEKKQMNKSLPPYILETDGTTFNVLENENLKLSDLLYGMMVRSGNDASNMAAEATAGSVETFMENLNIFINEKGCKDTHLCNPHGLHIQDHISTAKDISYMLKQALTTPKFLDYFSTKFYVRPKTNKQAKKELITFNELLKPGKFYYKDVIGAKTGYHGKARYNLVSVANKGDRSLIAVVLGTSNSDNRYLDTIKLFESAFSENKEIKQVMSKDKVFKAKIPKASKILKTKLKEDIDLEYYPAEEGQIKGFIFWDDVKAPIKKGQKVASLVIKTENDEILKEKSLYAQDNIRRSFLVALKEFFIKD
ncbi:MAG: D-alanyl-D-alanine carboxypeptidase DacF [Candidatus Anoxychlamydiales bacterium]|nr:D-alanyl-D-alanine carboxypeptidase DacF [Candidatus Anoxychlamydiales bacterium]NGX35867.1 D-alanyl-D-alanine carboxypeptidase DacF [Candidatus Anoxychlamydiales bacterium]